MEPEVAIRNFARDAGWKKNLLESAPAVACSGRPGRGSWRERRL